MTPSILMASRARLGMALCHVRKEGQVPWVSLELESMHTLEHCVCADHSAG